MIIAFTNWYRQPINLLPNNLLLTLLKKTILSNSSDSCTRHKSNCQFFGVLSKEQASTHSVQFNKANRIHSSIAASVFTRLQPILYLAFVEKKGIRNIQKGESELASLTTIRYFVKQPSFSICRRPKYKPKFGTLSKRTPLQKNERKLLSVVLMTSKARGLHNMFYIQGAKIT